MTCASLTLFLFALLAPAQTTYQGLTPGQSRRANVDAVLRAPVRQLDAATWQHSPLQGTGPIDVQYENGDVVARIQVAFVQPIVRSVLVERLLGNRPPEARQTAANGALVEYFGDPAFSALTYAGADESRGAISITYFSRDLYNRTLGRSAAAPTARPTTGTPTTPTNVAQSDSEFRVRLLTRIDTRANKPGDRISAQVLTPATYQGGTLEGQIRESRTGNKIAGRASLGISFDVLRHGGKDQPIRATVQRVMSSKGMQDADDEGRIVTKKNRLGATALATDLGALIGALQGGGKGAAIGAGIGAGAALATIELAAEGANVAFEPGSEFVLAVEIGARGQR